MLVELIIVNLGKYYNKPEQTGEHVDICVTSQRDVKGKLACGTHGRPDEWL